MDNIPECVCLCMCCVRAYMHPLEFMCVHNMSCFVHFYQSIIYVVRVIFCVCEGTVCACVYNYAVYEKL